MSASVGLLFLASSAAAAMICPGWQYPHSGTSPARHAIWSGCCALGESPSIVVTSFPAAWLTGCTHERTALPFTCTVHAPHCAIPHPYLVPVSPIVSRITHSRGVSGSTSTAYIFPLILSESMQAPSNYVESTSLSQVNAILLVLGAHVLMLRRENFLLSIDSDTRLTGGKGLHLGF